MARFLDRDDAQGRAALAAAGVRVHAAVSDGDSWEADPTLVEAVLPDGMRAVKGVLVAEPPAPGQESAGMGAWHVNAVDELHVVTSGTGIMEFATADGPVAVLLEAGDVVEIRRAEHRYRPLAPQGWVLRFAAPPGGDLGAVDTARVSAAWPAAD